MLLYSLLRDAQERGLSLLAGWLLSANKNPPWLAGLIVPVTHGGSLLYFSFLFYPWCLFGCHGNIAVSVFIIISQGFLVHAGCKVVGSQGAGNVVPYAEDSPRDCRSCTEVEHGKIT